MAYLEEYFKSIREEVLGTVDDITVLGSDGKKGSVKEDPLYIYENILKKGHRLINGHVTISFFEPGRGTPFFFRFNEFSGSCGRLMVYSFGLGFRINSIEYGDQIEKETKELIMPLMSNTLTLLTNICKECGYSSFHFMLSNEHNPSFIRALNELNIKPINTFKNARYNPNPHTCHDYIINI